MIGMFSEYDFKEYDFVVLDASCFIAPEMDASLLDSLRESCVYISTTFEVEALAYQDMLSLRHKTSYKTFTAQFSNLKTPDNPQSTWEMIRHLAGEKKRMAVVTGNRLLIERMILEDAPPVHADIYDLFRKEWIPYGDFHGMRESVELQKDEPSQLPPGEAIGYGTSLYTSGGEEVSLCRLEISGTESELFGVENLDGERLGIAKIFRAESLTPGKCEHLRQLKEFAETFNSPRRLFPDSPRRLFLDSPWCLFPKEILYRDASRQIFAGVLEEYVSDCNTLYDLRLHQDDSTMKLSDNLRVCYSLVQQICYLNNYGFFISDFNLKNFALRADSERILMFHADSFGYKNYFPCVRADSKYDTTTKKGALSFCEDALYVTVFSLLSLGSPKEKDCISRFDENMEDRRRKNLFPPDLWTFFENAFRSQKEFSPEKLLLALYDCLNRLQMHPEEDFVYIEKLVPKEKVSSIKYLFQSGAADRILLFLAGLSIAVLLYILYRNGFF